MKNFIFAVFPVFLLTACSTHPVATANVISPAAYNVASSDTATVTVARDGGLPGGFCPMRMSVDDVVVGTLKPSDSLVLHVPSGRHILSFTMPGGVCLSVTDAVDMNLQQGDVKKYRIRSDHNGNYQLLPTL